MRRAATQRDAERSFSLRLFAWRSGISPDSKRLVVEESYDCSRDCQRPNGAWDDEARAARGCKREGLPPVEAKPTARALYQLRRGSAYMGRAPDKALAGDVVLGLEQRPASPFEQPEHGCPGAYYRTNYVDDLWPLTRRRTREGGRVPNPAFDRAHWTAQAAVAYLEAEEERWYAHLESEQTRRMQAQLDKAQKERGR